MVRAALDVLDPVASQLRLELRRAAPRRVLAPLVGQNLPWRSILRNAARQRFQHQSAALMVGHRQAHEITRVIIEKRRDIDPFVPPQQEREQIRLPQLVRLSALEALRDGLGPRLHHRTTRAHAFGLQHPAHRRGRGADA
jgi:hypothetical protein